MFPSASACRRAVRAGLVAFALATAAAPVRADDDAKPPPTKEQQKEAAKKFREGELAFIKHDYLRAAASFEDAYDIAPHPDVLFNAIDAHDKGGNLARAATLCARLVREFPTAENRSDASERLAKFTPKLGRVDISAKGKMTEVLIDGRPAEVGGESYVDPGDHVVTGRVDERFIEKPINVVAGARVSVLLDPPVEKPKGDNEGTGGTGGPIESGKGDVAPPRDEKPLHPAVFFIGAGLTAAAGGVLIWSGIDTLGARDDFDAKPTQTGLDDGRSKQLRTNILIGVTGGLGVVTAAIGIFATEWGGGGETVEAAISPSGGMLRGTF